MENKYKSLDTDIENFIVDIDEYNTHFNNHMSGNYKGVITKGIIIIQLGVLITLLLI